MCVCIKPAADDGSSHQARPDDTDCDVATDTQTEVIDGADSKADQWMLDPCDQPHDERGHYQSSQDEMHNCCCGGGDGCYDDSLPAFFVDCHEHQTASVVDGGDSTGVQLYSAPSSFELLLLIDQLTSAARFVDSGPSFVTVFQTAAAAGPSEAPATYIDSSPRIVELGTEDEEQEEKEEEEEEILISDAGARDADDALQDNGDGQLNRDIIDKSVSAEVRILEVPGCDEVEEDVETSAVVCICVCGQSKTMISKDRGQETINERENKPAVNDTESQIGLRLRDVPDVRGADGGRQGERDTEPTTKRCDDAAGRLHKRQHRLPPLDARKPTASKRNRAAETTSLYSDGACPGRSQRQQLQRRVPAEAQRDKFRLPDAFVGGKLPLPTAAKPCLGGGLRLPPVSGAKRVPRDGPRFCPPPPPPQRRRSHPLAPRRPMTPPNRNVLASRAVWPSMASGRPIEDDWTRRAAVMRRHHRLPPLDPTAAKWD